MTETHKIIEEIEAALAAGPTPGPWYGKGSRVGNDFGILTPDKSNVLAETFSDIRYKGEHALREAGANALLIQACNPTNITAVLAEITRLSGVVEELRGALNKANSQAEAFERKWYLRGDAIEELRESMLGMIAVADRDTDEFNRAKRALAATGEQT